jgi:ABC-type Fe3+-hydroxamate transport system substrate-binding protein
MKKWIIMIIAVTILFTASIFLFSACGSDSSTAEAEEEDSSLVCVEKTGHTKILVDTDTGVCYLVVNYAGTAVCIMENPDGTNKTYEVSN